MKKRVVFILIGIGTAVSAGKLSWLDAGIEQIEAGIIRHRQQQLQLAAGNDLLPHDKKLVSCALKRVVQIQPHVPEPQRGAFERTKARLHAVITHKGLSWDVYVALHLQLAKLLITTFTPFASRSAYTQFGPYIESWQEEVVPVEHMGAFLREKRAFGGLMMVLPLFARTAEEAILGVRALNMAFAHGVIPIILVPEAPDVHGGMIPTPFDFIIHDWAHGYYFWKEFFSHASLRTQLPIIQALLERHKGKKPETLKFHAQLILYLHEWSAHLYGHRPSEEWDSAFQYYDCGKEVLRSFMDVTLEAAEEKLATQCLQDAIRNAKYGFTTKPLIPIYFTKFKCRDNMCLSTLTVRDLSGATTEVVMSAAFSRSADDMGYPVATCRLFPLQEGSILERKPDVLRYETQGDDYVLRRNAFRDLGVLLAQVGALPTFRSSREEPLLGPELWRSLATFMSDFNFKLFTPDLENVSNGSLEPALAVWPDIKEGAIRI